jgi:hypothetical protein
LTLNLNLVEGEGVLTMTRGSEGDADCGSEFGFSRKTQIGMAEIQAQLAARRMHHARLRRDDDVLLHGSALFQPGLAGIEGLI